MSNKVAVVGAGMTRFVRRAEETSGELAAEAVELALADAGLTINDIDAVCLGTAPDAFDGIHLNGENLLAGAGASNKPYLRHYVGGGTGVFDPIHGWMHVASGRFETCLVVAEEKMSPCQPHPAGAFLTIFDHTTEQPLLPTLIHIFGIEMARFMHVYGWTEEEIASISVQHKRNALDHPAAQIAEDLTIADVMNSRLLSWPVKRLDISPTSDAAVAIVLANERVARSRNMTPVWIDGVGYRLDTAYWCTRDLCFPEYVALAARDAYKMAGISRPDEEIDIFEPYDPFDYKALHHMNGLLLDRSGRKVRELFDAKAFARDGTHPMCPSGGAIGVGNPIAATGLMKIVELYLQLSGQAGKRQVAKHARRGVAQAWGDLMQVGTVVVMGADGSKPNRASFWNTATPEDLPGTGIKGDQIPDRIEYKPDLRYAWDNGAALTTYLDGFKAGKIRASQCSKCGRMMIPTRTFCEQCNLQAVDRHFDMPDTGTVKTFTLSHVDWASLPLPDGQVDIFAVIEIDGAGENVGLMHKLGEVDPKDVKFGMRVKAVWKPAKKREGSVTDLLYFRPLRPEEDTREAKPVPVDAVKLTAETAKAFPGEIPMQWAYTTGLGGKRFYADLAKGKLSGTWCPDCEQVLVPPANFCEIDMHTLDPEGEARAIDPSSGWIAAATLVAQDRIGAELEDPVWIVQVEFPEATGSVFGRLDAAPDAEVGAGMRVKVVSTKKLGADKVTFRLVA
jgi:acetyl-CoA C-acetyltransferase